MAFFTLASVLPLVRVVLRMAGVTLCGGAFIAPGHVAGGTSQIGVPIGQREEGMGHARARPGRKRHRLRILQRACLGSLQKSDQQIGVLGRLDARPRGSAVEHSAAHNGEADQAGCGKKK